MNVSDFKQLLQNPKTTLSLSQTKELEAILEEYPFFQATRALHLKGLKNLESHKYNTALKVAAAHTTDREVLFDYITSKQFDQKPVTTNTPTKEKEAQQTQKEVKSKTQTIESTAETFPEDSEKAPLLRNIQEAEKILDPTLFTNKITSKNVTPAADLQLGKPLHFDKSEKHSFSKWLQLTQVKPIHRESISKQHTFDQKKKFELLDKFITDNPRIVPKESIAKVDISNSVKIDQTELMTETLAKVYLEQRKFKKAIQAFRILSLKYPEKSSFFADQIKAVKKLQKEKD